MSVTHRFSQLGLQTQASSSSLLNGAVTTLAEANPGQADARLLDYLSIEMVDIMIQAAELRLNKLDAEIDQLEAGVDFDTAPGTSEARKASRAARLAEETRERLDALGYRLGYSLAERLSRDRPPFPKPKAAPPDAPPQRFPFEPLDLVKFLCRDVWSALYQKQIDNLRTNHRGVFVLHDASLPPLRRMSCSADLDVERDRLYEQMLSATHVPCGVIRGALACLGMPTTVTPELGQGFASCAFQIKIIK